MLPSRLLKKQYDNEQTKQCKRNVAVNAPYEWRIWTQPAVLRTETQKDTECGQQVYDSRYPVFSGNVIAAPPYIIQENVKNRHCDGGDELADTEGNGIVFQSGGAQRECARNQMEGVAKPKHDCHNAEQPVLSARIAFANYDDSEGNDCD